MPIGQTEKFEYTSLAENVFYDLIEDESFFDKESDTIYECLKKQGNRLYFCDFLKRFIYRRLNPGGRSRHNVDYHEYIVDLFNETGTPPSLNDSATKITAAANNWLTQKCVSRETIFILGFGLKMTVSEVSNFLVNSIGDTDFDFKSPFEVICWYCYRNELSYADMCRLMEKYEKCPPEKMSFKINFSSTAEVKDHSLHIGNEEELMRFLSGLKAEAPKAKTIFEIFDKLYSEACSYIAAKQENYNEKPLRKKRLKGDPDSISALDFERYVYIGVPIDKHGNLLPVSKSEFCDLFGGKRLNRKRISDIKKRIKLPERFDIITLCFICSAVSLNPDRSIEEIKRTYYKFAEKTNLVLKKCRMGEMYAANAYENFLLMCMMSHDPMLVFSDVWEMSYPEASDTDF